MKIYFITKNENKQAVTWAHLNSIEMKDTYSVELVFANNGLQEIFDTYINKIVIAKTLRLYKYVGASCFVGHGGIFIEF